MDKQSTLLIKLVVQKQETALLHICCIYIIHCNTQICKDGTKMHTGHNMCKSIHMTEAKGVTEEMNIRSTYHNFILCVYHMCKCQFRRSK